MSWLENKLAKRRALGNLRRLPALVDFASNDYLGIAKSQALIGSTGSRLLTGNSRFAESLEEHIAAFHGYAAGTLFNCGYMANLGLISSVADRDDTIFFDAHVHASTRDGIRLSRSQSLPFRHNDLDHLENRLKRCSCPGERFLCVESVYSTDGSIAPLREIADLAQVWGVHLIIDEAHATGVLGPQGRGLVAEMNLQSQVFAQVTTFGKALGAHGAIVLGNALLRQTLINFATSFVYTTALPRHMLEAIHLSYELFPLLEKERGHIRRLAEFFGTSTPIQALSKSGNEAVLKASQELAEAGFDVRALMSPTVQRGHEMLRICLHAFNTEEQVLSLRSYYG